MKIKSLHLIALPAITTLICLPLLAAACSKPAEQTTYKIAFIDSMTGQYAPVGVDVRVGEQMAIDDVNAAGGIKGHKLEALSYDDESNPVKSAELVRKAKDQGALAAIGGPGLPIGMAASQAADTAKIIYLPISPVNLPLEKGHPGNYVFGGPYEDFDKTLEMWVRLALQAGGKRFAAIQTNDPVGQLYEASYKRMLAENPGLFTLVGIEWMLTTDTDVTPQLTKLKALNPDVLFVAPSGTPATVVYKDLDLMNWNIPAVTTGANTGSAFIDSVKGFSQRVLLTTSPFAMKPGTIPTDDPSRSKELSDLHARIRGKINNKVPNNGVYAVYENVYSLVDVMNKLDLDPDKQSAQEMTDLIRNGLENQTYQTRYVLLKRTPQDHRGAGPFRSYLVKIDGDAFAPVSWIEYPSMASGKIK